MKKGVSLGFSDTGKISINFLESVEGFEATIQNTIVNIATEVGSDVVFSNKGTLLRHKLLIGGMFHSNASHICNYAMIETQNFINTNNTDSEAISDAALHTEVTEAKDGLNLKITATSTEGNTSKLTWAL
jgi:hypothetical protein